MRQLPSLELLAVQSSEEDGSLPSDEEGEHEDEDDGSPPPAALVLVPGPWQGTLRQLAANAGMLLASLPALGAAAQLQELGIGLASKEERAMLKLLLWLAEQPQLPLRRLALQLYGPAVPSPKLFDACMVLQNHHPALTIQLASIHSDYSERLNTCADLLTA